MAIRKGFIFVLLSIVALVFSSHVLAGIFSIEIDLGKGGQYFYTFNSVQQAIDKVTDDFLSDQFPGFDPATDTASGRVNFRGIIMNVKYTPKKLPQGVNALGFDTLEIIIPSIGVDQKFNGDGKADLDKQVQDWLKGESNGVIKKVYQAMVSETPLDPIAGNPSSLMGNMIEQAFEMGNDLSGWSQDSYNLFSLSPAYENASVEAAGITQGGGDTPEKYHVQSTTVPLYYAHVFSGGRQTLMVDMPVTQYRYDNSMSYTGELGVALANKVNQYWELTPEVIVGGAGSIDMGSLSLVYSGFVKSHVSYPYNHWFFSLNDMAGYLQTQGLKIDGFDTDYGLKNWAFDNGVGVGYKWVKYLVDLRYAHTNIAGSAWYIDNYNTLTLDIAKIKKIAGLQFSQLSVDMNYGFANASYQMFTLGMKYQF